jgi:hypothetical protein
MKTEQATQVLRDYNLWRRADEDMDQPDPREIGRAIDAAIKAMEQLNEWRTLMSWGGTPEIINDFIKGQQSRIYAAQKAEEQRDRLAEELDGLKRSILDLSHPNMKFLLEERNKAQAELDEERKEGEEQARLLGMGSEREAKLMAERDLWRAEAQRWREQALDLEAQIETVIKRLQWRQDNLDRGIKELKSGY